MEHRPVTVHAVTVDELKDGLRYVPSTFRHTAAAVALDPELPLVHRLVSAAASLAMTLVQLILLVSVSRANWEAACMTNNDCMRGTFCRPSRGRCIACGHDFGGSCDLNMTAALWIVSLPEPSTPLQATMLDVAEGDYEYMCAGCVNPSNGRYIWANEIERNHVAFMQWRDWLALSFASLIMALFAAHELHEIKLGDALVRERTISRGAALGLGWRGLFWAQMSCLLFTNQRTRVRGPRRTVEACRRPGRTCPA